MRGNGLKALKTLYLFIIDEFTSLYPGFIKLRKKGDCGCIYLKLWPEEYGYGLQIDNDFENIYDPVGLS